MDATTILIVEKLTPPPVSTKRDQDEEQQSHQDEGSQKRTHITERDTSKEMNPFMQVEDVFSSRLAWTPKDATTTVPISNLSFIQNLPKGNKMELASKLSHNMFKAISIFFVVSVRHEDVLPPVIPPRKWIVGTGMSMLWR